MPREGESNGRGGRRFTKWELVEWSLVPVPANAEAVRVLKGLDLWTDTEQVLDVKDDVLEVSGFTEAELARLAAGEAARRRGWRSREPYEPVVCDLEPAEVRAVIAAALPDLLRSALRSEIEAAFRRARGRVD